MSDTSEAALAEAIALNRRRVLAGEDIEPEEYEQLIKQLAAGRTRAPATKAPKGKSSIRNLTTEEIGDIFDL